MNTQIQAKLSSGALWRCQICYSWWGSQVGKRSKTDLLVNLPESLASDLDWADYRGWKLKSTYAAACPECGTIASEPIYLSN